MTSPIQYFGGKTYMTDIIISHFPTDYDLYVEGFGGGASILLNKPKDRLEIYNDLNDNVYALFCVINDEEMLCKMQQRLLRTYYSEKIHYEFVEKLKDKNLSIEDRAFYFFYVNRTSFNGVGGFSINLLIRRNLSKSISSYLSSIDMLSDVHDRMMSVIIEHKDIMDLLDRYDNENTFFYLDPPYVQSTRCSNQKYDTDMTDDQHIKFVDRLLSAKSKILVSGYNHPIYDKLTDNGWNKYEFKSNNTLSTATEVLWYNYDVGNKKIDLF